VRLALLERLARWPTYAWLGVLIGAYFAFATAGTWINYLELHINAGGLGLYDLALNQQALASTVHSSAPYPFYDATTCGRTARCSLLLTHPVFLAYVVAIPYGIAPSAFTLFAIQDAALGLAALPLFAISRRVLGSDRWSLVVAAVYLAWLPSFTGIFSFHWEAFIPLEMFSVFFLWMTRRYWLSIPIILLSFVTLEVMPVLMCFLALYFLWDYVIRVPGYLLRSLRILLAPPGHSLRSRIARVIVPPLSIVRRRADLQAALALIIGSGCAYLALHEFVQQGEWLLGLPSLPAQYQIPVSRPVYSATLSWASLTNAWTAKLLFWIVMFGTLAFIPLFAPRAFLLSAPWIAYSSITSSGFYRMGDQYAFISAAVLFVGFVYGLARLRRWAEPSAAADSRSPVRTADAPPVIDALAVQPGVVTSPTDAATESPGSVPSAAPPRISATNPGTFNEVSAPAPGASPSRKFRGRRVVRYLRTRPTRTLVLGVVLVSVLAFNIALNPLDPYTAGAELGAPFAHQENLALGGQLSFIDYRNIEHIVGLIGDQSVVAASEDLFTFVANDPNAFPLDGGMNYSLLPFNVTASTQFLLLNPDAGAQADILADHMNQSFQNTSEWGIRAWIPRSGVGTIWLLERGYSGPIRTIGNPYLSSLGLFTVGKDNLDPGPAGETVRNSTAAAGRLIRPAANPTSGTGGGRQEGVIFTGPTLNLAPGVYNITLNLAGYKSLAASEPASAPVATIGVSGLTAGYDPYSGPNLTLNHSAFARAGWNSFSFTVNLTGPVAGFEVVGASVQTWFMLEMDYISVSAAPSD
jgi:uncharacterized membrane protein